MPKLEEMAQLSRPFQIAFVAVCLLAAVWLFALRGHSTSTSGSGSTAVVSTTAPSVSKPASSSPAPSGSSSTAAAEAKSAAHPTAVYHGAAPGVEGLTRDINRAHKAVAESQQNAKALEEKSAQASGESASASGSSTASTSSAASTSSQPATPATQASSSATATAQHPASTSSTAVAPAAVKPQPIKAHAGAGRTPARQALVEGALKEGKVAVILFWNSKGADDVAVSGELRLLEAIHHLIRPFARVPQVRRQLEASGLELGKKFAAFESPASQVASYGSITRGVQIYATPTILVINKAGKTITLTGLQDAFSIEQAIDEARNS
jgi:hypothetical protein